MNAALAIIAVCGALAIGLALRARGGRDMDLEQWAVGGRGFGWIFVFLLLAGEIYTTFTFLGASGFVLRARAAPVYYILAYGSLAYILSYFLLPVVWSYARPSKLHSQPDVFVRNTLADARRVVSIVDLVALIPYLVLQLTGLGIIVTATSTELSGDAGDLDRRASPCRSTS